MGKAEGQAGTGAGKGVLVVRAVRAARRMRDFMVDLGGGVVLLTVAEMAWWLMLLLAAKNLDCVSREDHAEVQLILLERRCGQESLFAALFHEKAVDRI